MKIRRLNSQDIHSIRDLVAKCKPLDLHTLYSYWIIIQYFNKYSFVLESSSQQVGLITSLDKKLDSKKILFIWQIGVIPEFRGKKLGEKLLHHLVESALNDGINYFQFSIDPNNTASLKTFQSIATNFKGKLVKIDQVSIKDDSMRNKEFEDLYELSIPELKT